MTRVSRKSRRLVLGPVQTLRTIEATCASLRDVLSQHKEIAVDCSAVDEADLTLVQLLLAARKSADRLGKRLHLTAPAAGSLRDALLRGGLLTTGADELASPFWLEPSEAS